MLGLKLNNSSGMGSMEVLSQIAWFLGTETKMATEHQIFQSAVPLA